MKRQARGALIVLLGTLIVTVLGVSAFAEGQKESAGMKTMEVLIVEAGDEEEKDLYNTLASEYEEKYPNVNTDLEFTSWSGYWEKIVTAYASGTAPDAWQTTGMGEPIVRGMVMPLDEYAADWGGMDDFPEPVLAESSYDGHLYQVPYRLDTRTLYYRKDHFREAGLDPNAAPQTWDDLLNAARKLVVREGGVIKRAGMNVQAHWQYPYTAFLFQAGGNLFSPDGTEATVNEDPSVEALSFIADLVNEHKVSVPGGMEGGGGVAAIVYGTASMDYTTESKIHQMKRYAPDSYDELGLTKGLENETRTTIMFVNAWQIFDTSEEAQEAWNWIAHISSRENMLRLTRTSGHLPPRKSLWDESPWNEDPKWSTFLELAEIAHPWPKVYGLEEMLNDHVQTAISEALHDVKSPRRALNDANRKMNALLEEAEQD